MFIKPCETGKLLGQCINQQETARDLGSKYRKIRAVSYSRRGTFWATYIKGEWRCVQRPHMFLRNIPTPGEFLSCFNV